MIGELVEQLARVLVRDPNAVSAQTTQTGSRVDVALQVALDDFGRVIGKSGQNIGAIRTLATFAGRRQGLEVSVEVVEEARRSGGGSRDAEAD